MPKLLKSETKINFSLQFWDKKKPKKKDQNSSSTLFLMASSQPIPYGGDHGCKPCTILPLYKVYIHDHPHIFFVKGTSCPHFQIVIENQILEKLMHLYNYLKQSKVLQNNAHHKSMTQPQALEIELIKVQQVKKRWQGAPRLPHCSKN